MGINTAYDLLPLKENFSPQKLINYNLQENLHQHNDGKIIIDYSNFKVKQEKKHNSHIIEETVDFTYYPWS